MWSEIAHPRTHILVAAPGWRPSCSQSWMRASLQITLHRPKAPSSQCFCSKRPQGCVRVRVCVYVILFTLPKQGIFDKIRRSNWGWGWVSSGWRSEMLQTSWDARNKQQRITWLQMPIVASLRVPFGNVAWQTSFC